MALPYDSHLLGRLRFAAIEHSATGDTVLVAAGGARKRVQLYQLFFVVDAATIVRFKSGSVALTGPMPLAANGSVTLDNNREPWLITAEAQDLILNQTGTALIGGVVGYYIVDCGSPGA